MVATEEQRKVVRLGHKIAERLMGHNMQTYLHAHTVAKEILQVIYDSVEEEVEGRLPGTGDRDE